MSFKVGDRVRGKGMIDGIDITGLTGKILEVCDDGYDYAIRFDNPNYDEFHDLDGLCEKGYGWWVNEEYLELLTEERPEPGRVVMMESLPITRFIVESTEGDYLFTRKDDFQGVPVYRKEKLNRNLCKHKNTCKDHIGDAGIQCNPANCGRYEL